VFIVKIQPLVNGTDFEIDATFQFNYKNGFISANDWPFLPVISILCNKGNELIFSHFSSFMWSCALFTLFSH
jgi:hypothetical protein